MPEELTSSTTLVELPTWDALAADTRRQWDSLVTQINLPPMYTHPDGRTVDNFRPRELAAEIESDPVISGTIISVANSAKVGLASPIMTVDRAIVHLGFNLIVSIISSYQLQQALGQHKGLSREFLGLIRRWSATARTASLHFFKRAGLLEQHEEAPTVALLARLGTVILAMSDRPPHSRYLTLPDELLRLAHEQAEWGVSSPVLSGRLVSHWGLPEPIPRQVANLWQPVMRDLEPSEENRCLTLLAFSVNIADTYINYSRITPEEILGRNSYRVLGTNLARMGLLDCIEEAWASKLMERELDAASF